jgi:hypothetical protein
MPRIVRPVAPFLEVEIHHPVDAGEVERAVGQERRHGDGNTPAADSVRRVLHAVAQAGQRDAAERHGAGGLAGFDHRAGRVRPQRLA